MKNWLSLSWIHINLSEIRPLKYGWEIILYLISFFRNIFVLRIISRWYWHYQIILIWPAILKRFNIIFVNNENSLWVHHIGTQCYNRFRIIERWQHTIKIICCPWESEPCIPCSFFNLNMIPLQICRLLPSRFNRRKEEDSHFMFEDGSKHFIQQLKTSTFIFK